MAPSAEQNDWVLRVLALDPAGVAPDSGASPAEEEADPLAGRLAEARLRYQGLLQAGSAAAADLAAQMEATARLVESGAATGDDLSDLEDALLAAETSDRVAAISQEIRIPLSLKKMLIDWRAAQAVAESGIGAIGDAFLADATVQQDPRFDAVFDTVKELPELLPSFGRSLDQTIDALLSDGAKSPAVLAASLKAVADCRARLNSAAVLGALEELASRQYGGEFRAYTPMVESLARIERELQALGGG